MLKKFALSGALLLAMSTSAYSATVISFNSFVSGDDLGAIELATLTATQVGTGVEIVFENTYNAPGTFDTQLLLGYDNGPGPNTTGISEITGYEDSTDAGNVDVNDFSNDGNINNAGNSFDLEVAWDTSNQGNRLEFGETSTFILLGADITKMFAQSLQDPFGMIHVQGLPEDNGQEGSTKYAGVCISDCTPGGGGEPEPIPLPGAALLFVSGIGSLWWTRRRRRHETT